MALKIEVNLDGIIVHNPKSLPKGMHTVYLGDEDAEYASALSGLAIAPGEYTIADGDPYLAALAATLKGTRVNAKLIR